MRIARDLRTARILLADYLRIIGILPRYEVMVATSDHCWGAGRYWVFHNACMAAKGLAADPDNRELVDVFVACRTGIDRVSFRRGTVECGGWATWIKRDGVPCGNPNWEGCGAIYESPAFVSAGRGATGLRRVGGR